MRIVASLTGCKSDEWHSYLQQVDNADLLIIDDLGAERDTDFAQECIYAVVNQRVASAKPILVTTIIPPDIMRGATDIRLQRIYSRILHVCLSVYYNGNYAHSAADCLDKFAKELLS